MDNFDENSSDSSYSNTSQQSLGGGSSGALYTPILTSSSASIVTPAITPAPAILAAQLNNSSRKMGGRRPAKHERVSLSKLIFFLVLDTMAYVHPGAVILYTLD